MAGSAAQLEPLPARRPVDIEALVQRDQMAAPDRRQQHHRQREDMKQRQHADHTLDGVALGASVLDEFLALAEEKR